MERFGAQKARIALCSLNLNSKFDIIGYVIVLRMRRSKKMINAKFGLCSFIFSLMLGVAPAWADVDISQVPEDKKVYVSDWSGLKSAVESAAEGTVIVLTKDIQAKANNPITGVGNTGVIIDGGGFTITGQEGSSDEQFIQFYSDNKNDLIIQNVNLDGFYLITDKDTEASGGAIHNRTFINKIYANFFNNYAQSTTSPTKGGAIFNKGSINEIVGNFSQNNVLVESMNSAQGGAIYNRASIGDISGNFEGNYAKSDSSYAQGGAIYNSGTITLTNSSFIDNYVQTGALKDSEEGLNTQGGAIFSAGDLTIRADGGESIFRGNKVIWGDREDSSAVYFAGNLKLDSINNGLIQFDDKVSGTEERQTGLSKDEVDFFIHSYEQIGCEIKQDGENYIVTGTIDGMSITFQLIKQDDGTYTLTMTSGEMTITGDSTSKVVFNNAIEKVGQIDISGTNVDVNEGAGTIYRTVTHDGGVLNINAGATAEDSVVNDKGTLHVAAGGMAENTTVNSGGSLVADNEAKVNNMLANDGANLDIDAGSILTGDIVIHAGATMGGSYDYSQIFKDEVADSGSLTLVGGLNDVLNESSLINTTTGKKLHLTDGSYIIGDGAQAVNGWDLLTLQNDATVKLEGDITLTGPTKKMIIENGSELNLAGNSPTNYTITGSVSNDGSMTFTHAGDDADDITTIYGNYTAYNNAQMTIDVNPTANTSDLLRIDGDVAGTTTVNLKFVGADAETTKKIPFVEALNDDTKTGAYFIINRVYSSAYKWYSLYQDGVWYVGTSNVIPEDSINGYGDGTTGNMEDDDDLMADAELPDGFPTAPTTPDLDGGEDGGNTSTPSVVGEAIAYMGLPSAGIEQTRDMTRNISNKVASTKVYSKQCHGFYDCEYDGAPLRNAWAAPVYSYSDVKAPYSYEAEISGFEGGFDIQSDVYNRLGVFASYRQGSYDFDGDGDDYYSKTGADMDIDSYILGLYHRYDEGKMWTFAQIFLGYQDVSLSSDDGVSSSTDGIEFGASVEAGLIFNPMTNLTIEPLIRLAYTQINYDDATDNYGKTASYGDVRNIEVEAGVKVEKTYLRKNGYAKVYVKPSIIQNIGSGDVTVTSLRQVDGLENSTLGRIEVGGSMSFDERWSGYANAAYTFGSDYTNAAVNAGLNYAF